MLAWKKLGLQRSLGSRIVTYADDLVILCKRGEADEALLKLRGIMSKLKLTVNEEKTRICVVPRRQVRLPGLHVLAVVLCGDWAGPHGQRLCPRAGAE
nr:reverse transcriptase domain-containing protein [Caballeronia novacaledonica]